MNIPKKSRDTLFLLFLLFLTTGVFGQKNILDDIFHHYNVISIDLSPIHSQANKGDNDLFRLKDGKGGYWEMYLYDSQIISSNYISRFADGKGVHTGQRTTAIPMQGYLKGKPHSRVSMTFNNDFIYGFVYDEGHYTFIEPLRHFYTKAEKNKFIIYTPDDIKDDSPRTCAVTDLYNKTRETESISTPRVVGDCYIIDYAIANDFLMFQEYGSVAATENHAIGVINNVQTNYDDEFADEIQFSVVEQFTATSAASDPWTSSTDIGDLLDDFTDWAPNGFGADHDVATLWSHRDFDGNTIGLAWVGVVCTGLRYNVCQDWTSNANLKRVQLAHELGHNFSAEHDADGSPYIMAPVVNNSNQWSNASITDINQHVASRWCLSSCASSSPPQASFSFDISENCTPGEVQYFNTSPGSDLSFSWTFPGGIPSSSTLENPTVTYPDAGTYDATLTVTNSAGSDTETLIDGIIIEQSPDANFSFDIDETLVSFYNFSQSSTGYFWDFGDGSTSSQSDPIHDFLEDGVYTVTLTGYNNCGEQSQSQTIEIATLPSATFMAENTQGCTPLAVQFLSDASSNTDTYFWEFEGGNPATSTMENPVVNYDNPGIYDVMLVVANETGSDTTFFEDYIQVSGLPVADFEYDVSGNIVDFTFLGANADSYSWDFGDNSISSEQNPSHTYDQSGTYTVVLIAQGPCGEAAFTQEITISLSPVASFDIISQNSGCASLDVSFQSTSTNDPDSYMWTFEGGNPSTSTDPNPTITYDSPGVFDVSLTVSNAFGEDVISMPDAVTVFDIPTTLFDVVTDGLDNFFTNNSLNADTYLWDFGDGTTSQETNPSHTYLQEGVYLVSLSATNQCGTATYEIEINNYTDVTADFSVVNSSGCADLIVDFQNTSSDNVETWLWTFEGGDPASSTEENPIVTYTQPGTYDVTLTVSNPQYTQTITLSELVVVYDVPDVDFDYFDDLFDVQFTNLSNGGDSYLWDFGDGNTSSEENPFHTYGAEGTYDVTLTVTNQCGSVSYSTSIQINDLPTGAFSVDYQTGCAPLTVQFSDMSSSNVVEFFWTFEGGDPESSTLENPEITYTIPGTYDVILIVQSEAGYDTVTKVDYIQVLSLPVAEFSYSIADNMVTFMANDSEESTYHWDFGDGTTGEGQNIVHAYQDGGDYQVILTTANSCGEDTTTMDITIINTSSIEFDPQSITIFPNPAHNFIFVDFQKNITTPIAFSLWNTEGKMIRKGVFKSEKSVINVTNWTSGVYYLKIGPSFYKKVLLLD